MENEILIDEEELLEFILSKSSLVNEFKKHKMMERLAGKKEVDGRGGYPLTEIEFLRSDIYQLKSKLNEETFKRKEISRNAVAVIKYLLDELKRMKLVSSGYYHISQDIENTIYKLEFPD